MDYYIDPIIRCKSRGTCSSKGCNKCRNISLNPCLLGTRPYQIYDITILISDGSHNIFSFRNYASEINNLGCLLYPRLLCLNFVVASKRKCLIVMVYTEQVREFLLTETLPLGFKTWKQKKDCLNIYERKIICFNF